MAEQPLSRRSVVRALSVSSVAVTAGCLGFGPSVDLEYCNERLDRPCENTGVQKDVLQFENTVTSEETYPNGKPAEAAAVVVESVDRLVIYGWAVGNGDPNCRTFGLLQAAVSGRTLRFGVKSGAENFAGACTDNLAWMYYRAVVGVDTDRLDHVRITHVSGGSREPREVTLEESIPV